MKLKLYTFERVHLFTSPLLRLLDPYYARIGTLWVDVWLEPQQASAFAAEGRTIREWTP